MLAGAPGAGKKRLATEIAQYASRNGFRYYLGRCYERADPFPHLPFVEIIESSLAQAANLDDYRRQMGDNAAELAQLAPSLRRVFPDIPEPLELPPAQKRRFLFQSLSEALGRAARIRPLLLILDDLQWADESTLALLNHLANRITQLPLVIIGIYQEGYSENSPALVRTLEELIRLGVRPLKLGGLSKDAVAEMLHGLSGRQPPKSLVSLIFEESQGNPFFVEEVYRHLTEDGKIFDADGRFRDDIKIDETDVPENVRLIIGRRLGQFDENEKQVLAGAAVIGRSFSFRLLTAICQIDVDELFAIVEKAQRMGIVVSSSEGPETPFTFAHELVRQTLLAGISAPRHQQLHSNVADAIERLYPGAVNERAGEIADHLLKAKSFAVGQRLVQYLTLAGSSALEVAAFEEARGNFQSALSHQGAVGVSERAALLASLAKADAGLEQWDAALASLREALEIYVGLGDLGTISRTFTELTDALIWAGRFEQAIETARRGLVHLEKDVTVDRVSLLAALSQACATTAKYKWAQDALREAVDLASRLSDPKIKARAVGARSIVNFHFFHLREAADDGFLSEQLGGPQSPPWQRALQLRVLFQSLAYLGRREEAARVMGELVPLAKKIGQPYAVALCDSASAWAEFGKTPDLAKLDHDLQQASKSNQRARFAFWEAFAEVQLSVLNFLRGNWARALAHAQAACRPEPGRSIEGFGVGALFRQMAYAGDRAAAFSILDDRRAQLPVSGRPQTRGSWLMLAGVIEGLVILGEQKQAAQLYPLALELIATGAVVLWPISRFTQTIAGVAAAAANQWEAAEDHFQIALTQAEAFPHRLEEAEIRRFHAMMLLDRSATGDREKARTLLSAALDSYTHIAMPRHIDMIRALQTAAS